MAFKFKSSAEDYAKSVSTEMLISAFEEYDFDVELKEGLSIPSSYTVTDLSEVIDTLTSIKQYNKGLNSALVDVLSQQQKLFAELNKDVINHQRVYSEVSKLVASGTQVNLGKPLNFVQKAFEMIVAPFYKHHLSNSKSFIDIENTTQDVDHYTNVKAKFY
ncbi:hypothetical protein ACM1TL_14400 [Lysinibacillus capsici]|uniref:hypothetical protein n=1 Tax=Lysinibacillus capsici TaxID=2115968 RepID=UPI0039FD6B9D